MTDTTVKRRTEWIGKLASPRREIRPRNGRPRLHAPLISHTEIEGILAGSADLYHTDLNAEDKDDYIAVIWSDNIGLAAETYFVYITLPSADGYALWEVDGLRAA